MATIWGNGQKLSKIMMVTIFVFLGYIKGFGCTTFNCSFEPNQPCFLHQDTTDTFDWTFPKIGKTSSISTGPNNAVEGTSYAYIEASRPRKSGDVATLVSNSLSLTESMCLTYAYHMYGDTMGTLSVLLSDVYDRKTIIWSKTGNQGNVWHGIGIQLPPQETSIKISFKGIRNKNYTGDAAIDNIVITPGTCVEGTLSIWNSWGPCSVSCGTGLKARSRMCSSTVSVSNYGGVYCTKPEAQQETCVQVSCPINGMWGSWSTWSTCSVTCDFGSKSRTRQCNNPAPAFNGLECQGQAAYTATCNLATCPVNGMWGSWSTWSTCSVTCDVGSKSRTRQCNNPAPAFNGLQCQGQADDTGTCNLTPCPVDGMWGSWSTWNTCSVTCDVGSKSRTRQCNNPAPAFNGLQCQGQADDKDTCNLTPCPVDGMWGSWSTWSTCSVTCDVGSKSRTRQCNNPAPAFNGLQCQGQADDKDTCNLTPCPVDGMWGSWSTWSTCSVTCDVGSKSRTRQCNNPAPAFNGLQCQGQADDKDTCNLTPCPVDGGWASWRTWSACSNVNKEVIRAKCRKCINPAPQYGGDLCSGNQLLVEKCLTSGNPKRRCRCRRRQTPVIRNISMEELADIMDETKEELTVDKTQTVVAVRKKISAADSRMSSFAMGILGIIMFAIPVTFLVGIDLVNVYKYFENRNK